MARGKLYMVRHGESLGNVYKHMYTDDAMNFLSPYGEIQSRMCGHYFLRKKLQFSLAVSSDMTRARHTMTLVLREMNLEDQNWAIIPELNEIRHLSSKQSEVVSDIHRVIKGGNKFMEMWTEGDALLVTHYHVMQTLFDYVLKIPRIYMPTESYQGTKVDNAQPFVFDPVEGQMRMPDLYDLGRQY